MASRDFIVEFEFTSSKADSDNYKTTRAIRANSPKDAETIARIEGFSLFGARFTENCVDWNVIN